MAEEGVDCTHLGGCSVEEELTLFWYLQEVNFGPLGKTMGRTLCVLFGEIESLGN